jgi:regulator of nucleoside diphosphate kinase
MEQIMAKEATIYITKTDRERLGALVELVRSQNEREQFAYANKLEEELEFAEIVAPKDISADIITMRSKVRLKDMDACEEMEYSLVFPTEANSGEGKISILAPLATAILGRKLGDTVEFQAPARLRRLKVLDVLYQPESTGDYNL